MTYHMTCPNCHMTHTHMGISILQVLTRGLSLEPEFPFQNLAHQTPGYVGADLQALIREASLCAVNRLVSIYVHTSSYQDTPELRILL